eukprot:Protomagalhaensia_wolfi_Nauph_80__2460@NODE_2630_length_1034_cov_1837_013065_g1963_i1_p1_GENE_NODE_2630_length_1034_cov_1837_013065_g1963_i1NODE_2630_length_1034_cov_1837_013065_g1963_i1_p1_ORF_typecomplete_len109_score22_77_NODE_2630_length_1034_cov_1837_013065_g1963_i1362688
MDKAKSSLIDVVGQSIAGIAKKGKVPVEPQSLLIKTSLATAFHYAPQDAAVLGAVLVATDRSNSKLSNRATIQDPEVAIQRFLHSRGLSESDVVVSRSGKRKVVSLRN